MRKIILAIIAPALLGLLNIFLSRYTDVTYWFNHAMHFFGGFFAGTLSGAVMLLLPKNFRRMNLAEPMRRYTHFQEGILMAPIVFTKRRAR